MSDGTQLSLLAQEFPTEAHQSRRAPGGGPELTYISIDQTINRLNDVLGPGWSTEAHTTISVEEGNNGRPTYLCVCQLTLSAEVDGKTKLAYGVGAMKNPDPDMSAKTALAEAIKKAAHQLGVGLYLWDDDKRAKVEAKMSLAGASETKQKAAVYQLAREKLGKTKPTAKEVADLFGHTVQDMMEPETNRAILEAEGLI